MDWESAKWVRKYLPAEWCSLAVLHFDREAIYAALRERYFYLACISPFCCLGWFRKLDYGLTSFFCHWLPVAIWVPSECPDCGVRLLMSWRLSETHGYLLKLDHGGQGKYHSCLRLPRAVPKSLPINSGSWERQVANCSFSPHRSTVFVE